VSTGNNDPRSFMREGQGRGTTDASRKAFRLNLSIPVRARQVGPRRRTEGCLPLADR
jgi:hypothetical protein